LIMGCMLAPAALDTALRPGVGRGSDSEAGRGSRVDDIGFNEVYVTPTVRKTDHRAGSITHGT
jgi:hypothetical protein